MPNKDDIYYIAFDLVYDNVDIVNKYMDLQKAAKRYPEQIIILDMLCFEYIILSFNNLIEWTKSGRKDKIEMRQDILQAVENHRINIDKIRNQKTRNYLMGFRRYSTEKVIKSITYELTDGKEWSVKGDKMGKCWYKDCCVLPTSNEKYCNLPLTDGDDKFKELINDSETQRVVAGIIPKPKNQ